MSAISSARAEGRLACPASRWISALALARQGKLHFDLHRFHPAAQNIVWIFLEKLPLIPSLTAPRDPSRNCRNSLHQFTVEHKIPTKRLPWDHQLRRGATSIFSLRTLLLSKGRATLIFTLLSPWGNGFRWKILLPFPDKFSGGSHPQPAPGGAPRAAVAGGGPGTSQLGGREGRATPRTLGLQPLWNCAVNFRDAKFETSWWDSN